MGLAVDTTKPSSAAGDDNATELTAHVCTDGYVAPELLAVRKLDAVSYGWSIDIWSAAVVAYEVVSLMRFIASSKSVDVELRSIASRLGDVQNNVSIDTKFAAWQSVIAEPWQSLIALRPRRRPEERATAERVAGSQSLVLAAKGNKSSSSVAETATASSRPLARSLTLTTNPASSRRQVDEEEDCFPLRRGSPTAGMPLEQALPTGSMCKCSGNCGQEVRG